MRDDGSTMGAWFRPCVSSVGMKSPGGSNRLLVSNTKPNNHEDKAQPLEHGSPRECWQYKYCSMIFSVSEAELKLNHKAIFSLIDADGKLPQVLVSEKPHRKSYDREPIVSEPNNMLLTVYPSQEPIVFVDRLPNSVTNTRCSLQLPTSSGIRFLHH